MKPTGLFVACGVLAVLGGAVYWTKQHPKKVEPATPEAPKVLALGEDQIEEIHLSKPETPAIVLKKNGDKWQISEPQALAADQEAVKGLVSGLASLQSDRLVEQSPSDLGTFGLSTPKSEIDVTVKGGTVNKVLFGSENPSGTATYVRLASNPAVYTILTATRTNLDKTVSDLRDKRLAPFDREKVTTVSVTPSKGAPFELTRNGQNEWQLTKPRAMRADIGQADDLLRRIGDTKMDLTDADEKKAAAEFAGGTQVAAVSVRDAAGVYAVTVRKTKDNAYYAKSSAVEGTYKTSADLGEGLQDKSVDNFRNKKLFEFGFTDPTRLEIGDARYQKSGDKWTGSTLGQTDPASVQAVIDKLRDLSATSFTEKPAAGTPVITIGVTSGDKNKVEKVTVAKAGESYSAQRDGDPQGYVLDAKTVDELQKTIAGIKAYQPPKLDKKK